MRKANKKIPRVATSRVDSKEVRNPRILVDNKPAWRFSTVDLSGRFSWPKGTPIEQEILKKLHQFDSMTWQQIEGSDHHFLTPESLSRFARERLNELERDDEIESLFSFHLMGRPRMICIRDRNIAKLLWYDPNHEVCKSHKK